MHLEEMYKEVILDHYRSPHGQGLRDPFEVEVQHVNPTCGDEITLRLTLDRQSDTEAVVSGLSYQAQGCSISQASASVMFDQVQGQSLTVGLATLDEFGKLMRSAVEESQPDEELLGDAIAFSGVAKYPARVKCALLPWMAFKDAAARATVSEIGSSNDVGVDNE